MQQQGYTSACMYRFHAIDLARECVDEKSYNAKEGQSGGSLPLGLLSIPLKSTTNYTNQQ